SAASSWWPGCCSSSSGSLQAWLAFRRPARYRGAARRVPGGSFRIDRRSLHVPSPVVERRMPNYSYRPVDSPGYRQRSSLYQKPRRRSPRPFIALGLVLVILVTGGIAVGRTVGFLRQVVNFGNPLSEAQRSVAP